MIKSISEFDWCVTIAKVFVSQEGICTEKRALEAIKSAFRNKQSMHSFSPCVWYAYWCKCATMLYRIFFVQRNLIVYSMEFSLLFLCSRYISLLLSSPSCMAVCLCVRLICPPVCLICPSVCLFVRPFVSLSVNVNGKSRSSDTL